VSPPPHERSSWGPRLEVEHDAARHLLEAGAKQLDHGRHHPLERRRPGQVLEPAHRRLRARIHPRRRQPAARQLERRVGAQDIAVVAARVTGGDQQGAQADHLRQLMGHPPRVAGTLDAAREAIGDAEPALDLRQHQHPGIRGQPAAVERDMYRLAADR
jgi:hypothetical protein